MHVIVALLEVLPPDAFKFFVWSGVQALVYLHGGSHVLICIQLTSPFLMHVIVPFTMCPVFYGVSYKPCLFCLFDLGLIFFGLLAYLHGGAQFTSLLLMHVAVIDTIKEFCSKSVKVKSKKCFSRIYFWLRIYSQLTLVHNSTLAPLWPA